MAITEQATRRLSKRGWAFKSGPYRALDFVFDIRTTNPTMGRYLDHVFKPLTVGRGRAEHTYSLIDDGAGAEDRFMLLLDDEEILRTPMLRYPLAYLIWHVNQETVKRTSSAILLHAAAAERDGVGVIFPAAMESGKTTLVAGLVRSGFRYLTDEAVALDPDAHVIRPFPKSLAIDEGSFDVLADLEPDPPADASEFLNRQWHVDPSAIHPEAVAPPTRPRMVIVPRYEEGAETALVPMTRAEAVVTMIENSFNFNEYGARGLEILAGVARACSCFRLRIGDLETACRLVTEALEEHARNGDTPGDER